MYNGNVPLSVNFTNSSLGVTTTDNYNWIFGDGNSSSNINPTTIFTSEGSYSVILNVTDFESGCMDTTVLVINVEDDFIIVIPNVFTPSGYGYNDAFHIKISGAKLEEGSIYNCLGQLLHSWNAISDSWDGKAGNGENCPDTICFYIINVIDKNDVKMNILEVFL